MFLNNLALNYMCYTNIILKVPEGANKAAEGRENYGRVCFDQIQGES